MALKALVTDDRGNVSTYFRVVAIIEQYQTDVPIVTVQLYGYADETYREKEKLGSGQSLSNAFKEMYLTANDELGYSREDIYKRLASETADFSSSKEI